MSVAPKYSQRELSRPWGLTWCPTVTHLASTHFLHLWAPTSPDKSTASSPSNPEERGAHSPQAQTLGAWGHWQCSAGHTSPPPPPTPAVS